MSASGVIACSSYKQARTEALPLRTLAGRACHSFVFTMSKSVLWQRTNIEHMPFPCPCQGPMATTQPASLPRFRRWARGRGPVGSMPVSGLKEDDYRPVERPLIANSGPRNLCQKCQPLGSFRPKLNHSDGAILCQDQAKKRSAYPNTGKILGAGTGAKAPVPPGFRLAGAQRRTGLGRCTQIALQPFRHRIAAPIEKQN